MSRQYRQGDVLLEQIDAMPQELPLREVPRHGGRVVLAEGEATGHFHAIAAPNAQLLEAPGSMHRFLQLDDPCDLTHEEHSTIRLPQGCYRVRLQREYVEPPKPRAKPRVRRVRD